MALTRKVIIRYLLYLGTFLLGAFSGVFMTRFAIRSYEEIPRSGNPIRQATPVQISLLKDNDKWLASYMVELVPLPEIESRRHYLLLTLRRRSDSPFTPSTKYPSIFVLNGFGPPVHDIAFTIKGSQIDDNPLATFTMVVDIGVHSISAQSILNNNNLQITSLY